MLNQRLLPTDFARAFQNGHIAKIIRYSIYVIVHFSVSADSETKCLTGRLATQSKRFQKMGSVRVVK